jgi:GNAT superfamily N-acetyltransferase
MTPATSGGQASQSGNRMGIEIQEIESDRLPEYSRISSAFRVESRFEVRILEGRLKGFELVEEKLATPYTKDYDSYGDGGPERWTARFNTTEWGFFVAVDEGIWVGGGVLAYGTPGLYMLADRKDLAVLWDLRVQPDFRRKGIGTELFKYAVEWAQSRKCTQLKIETQNVNVPACRVLS